MFLTANDTEQNSSLKEHSLPLRKSVPVQDQWDLTPLFQDDSNWNKHFQELSTQISELPDMTGMILKSAEDANQIFRLHFSMQREIEKLYTYAHLRFDQDQTNQTYLAMYQEILSLYHTYNEWSSFIMPEIISLPEKTMDDYLENPALLEYSFFLQDAFRFKTHTRTAEIEQILAMTEDITQGPRSIFSQLDNTDFDFGIIEDTEGNKITLSHGNWSQFLQSSNRELREKAFFQYYAKYREHENTLSAIFASSIKQDYFYARARYYDSCLSQALFANNIPINIYHNLINQVRANLHTVHNYLKMRKEILGVEQLHFYDNYTPLISEIKFNMSFEEAIETISQALEILGEDYITILKQGLRSGWVDRYENKGKRSGAYSSGCYDSPPYILMNYDPTNINSLYTLIHESGHSMHTYLTNKNQPYHYHNYSIFIAEVASTFNEVLLSKFLLEKYKDNPKMQAYILNREIDNVRATLFRQTMFAEFELKVHELVERKKPLTKESMSQIYEQLLYDYFGKEMVIDPDLVLEFLRIPHFYSSFYVYQYATGLAAAIALAGYVKSGEKKARDQYLKFLAKGGSVYPAVALTEAGADLINGSVISDAMNYFNDLIIQFQNLLQEI